MDICKEPCLEYSFSSLTKNQSYTYHWYNYDTLFHKHIDFYELVFVSEGSYQHYYNNTTTTIKQGTLFLFNQNTAHRLATEPLQSCHFTICFEKQYFHFLLNLFFPAINIFDNSNMIFRDLNDSECNYMVLLANKLMSGEQESLFIKLFFHNALCFLLENPSKHAASTEAIVDDILEKIRNYTYLTCPIQQIYNQYPYSPPMLIRMFKQRTGYTIIQFQTNVKLDYAARLMRETVSSIEEIATNLGYESPSHFFKIFKKRYGMTPHAYRAAVRKNPEKVLHATADGV